ncbi:chitin synthase III catalytic subunit-domain-containing protein [Suillus variegatus]|nr:chitin synthase III catalytic subunit-domain-containing protein [Suillus variegatus]
MAITFGSFDGVCSTAALVICPLMGTSGEGIEPTCYSRNVQIGQTLIFQPSTCFFHIVAIIMTATMIYRIRSKYTAVGRKEIAMFFWMYVVIELLAMFLDSGIIPTSDVSYPRLVAAAYCCLLINGFVGFQFAEDGMPLSLWLHPICCFAVFGASFFIAIATFKSFVSFSPTKPITLFVIYLIWPIPCLILVFRTLDDRWPLCDITFGISFYAIAQVLLFAFSITICDAIKHYLDDLFFFILCVLLSVMMVYKYWDSITREDLESSVGSEAAVLEVEDPLLTASATTPGTDYEDASGAASIVGGVSGTQYYGGKKAYGAQGDYGPGGYGGARRAYPPTSEGY